MDKIVLLLLQIALILLATRAMGWLFRRWQQPQVIGEMLAGILLGPSLMGWMLPEFSQWIFPTESLGHLHTLSQVGVLLFMFMVGVEFEARLLRDQGKLALIISNTSIIFPFVLGSLLAWGLYADFSNSDVPFIQFALFMGAAMSVTAFPVLSRILMERNLLRTKVGALTIACAAIDDVSAWAILAGVIALVRSQELQSLLTVTLLGTFIYVIVMLWIVRPLLRKLEAYYHSKGKITQNMLFLILLLFLLSAWTTEMLGIHALFGAFMLGAILPKDHGFVYELSHKIEDLTVVLFLPLFFVYTGLRTQVNLLNGEAWLFCVLIIVVATVGKFGGATLAARTMGLQWRQAGAIGILMNTRGLVEVIILNIGLDLGVISPTVFAMMLIMALVTTFMTTPLLELIYPARLIRQESLGSDTAKNAYTVVIPVALPSSGPELLQVASALAPPEQTQVYALNLLFANDHSLAAVRDTRPADQAKALQPLLERAQRTPHLKVRPLSFVTLDAGQDINAVAEVKGANLILMGWHKPVLSQSILSGTIYKVMEEATTDVAVYLARQPAPWKRLLVPFLGGIHDLGALELARRIAEQQDGQVTILHIVQPKPGGRMRDSQVFQFPQAELKIIESEEPLEVVSQEAQKPYDLVIIGVSESWGLEPTVFGNRHERLAAECPASMLILRKYQPKTA